MANKEISELKQILGLQQGKDYSDPNSIKTLRYGHLMLMTDQVCLCMMGWISSRSKHMPDAALHYRIMTDRTLRGSSSTFCTATGLHS